MIKVLALPRIFTFSSVALKELSTLTLSVESVVLGKPSTVFSTGIAETTLNKLNNKTLILIFNIYNFYNLIFNLM